MKSHSTKDIAVPGKNQPMEKMTVLSVRGSRDAHSKEEMEETRWKLGGRIKVCS